MHTLLHMHAYLITSATAHHLLTSANGTENGLLQTGLHVLRLLKRRAVDPLQGLLTLHTKVIGEIKTCGCHDVVGGGGGGR